MSSSSSTAGSKSPTSLLVFLLLLLLFPAALLINPTTAAAAPWLFDFYELALQWGPGICSEFQCAKPTQQSFTIRGYRPTNYVPPSPSGLECRPIPWSLKNFTESITDSPVTGLKDYLHANWPQMHVDPRPEDADERFWYNEYIAHGICSVLAPDIYFLQASLAFASYDVLTDLAYSDIVPDDSTFYLAKDIQKALAGNPSLQCFPLDTPAGSRYRYVLTGIRFCFDPSLALEARQIKCQKPDLDTCGGANGLVLFPKSNTTTKDLTTTTAAANHHHRYYYAAE